MLFNRNDIINWACPYIAILFSDLSEECLIRRRHKSGSCKHFAVAVGFTVETFQRLLWQFVSWSICWWRSWCWSQWWWWCRVLSRLLLLGLPSLHRDDLPSRSMLVAAAAKQSHHQQQRTTQPPVSVFPVPCSGVVQLPISNTNQNLHQSQRQQLQVNRWPFKPLQSTPPQPFWDGWNSDTVRVTGAHISFLLESINNLWARKHRRSCWLWLCWFMYICSSTEMSCSGVLPNGYSVRHVNLGILRRLTQLLSVNYISFTVGKSNDSDDDGGGDVFGKCVKSGSASRQRLPACAPTPPTSSVHTRSELLWFLILCRKKEREMK